MTVEEIVEIKIQSMIDVIAGKVKERINPVRKSARSAVYPIRSTDRQKMGALPGEVNVRDTPLDGVRYWIGAHISGGLGEDTNCSAFSVVMQEKESQTIKQVAWFTSSAVDPIELAGVLDATGRTYNDAVIAPEVNRYDSTLHELRKSGYPNIYRWKTVDSLSASSSKLGWFTNQQSAVRLRVWFRRLMKTGLIKINDPEVAILFGQWYENSPTDLNGFMHDGHMRALMIAAFIAGEPDANL